MDNLARASARERAAFFQDVHATRLELEAAIAEKDFWVCWSLRRILEVLQFRPHLIFKGGTSLSKVYRAIERFSEDVDLSLSRRDLGFADDRDPEQVGISKSEARRRLDGLVSECKRVVAAAEVFPDLFTIRTCRVRTLAAERTFWEKATLLHAECHRPADKPSRERMSRHHYDLYRLSQQPVADRALAQGELLSRVITHKTFFFASAWAHYDTARPGTFRLLPGGKALDDLKRDYQEMGTMIFGKAPEWDTVAEGLRELERRINTMGQR